MTRLLVVSNCSACNEEQQRIQRLVIENAMLLDANPVAFVCVQPEGEKLEHTPILDLSLGDLKRAAVAYVAHLQRLER